MSAIAGRVAIVPQGDWSINRSYTRLDLVKYNGKLYVAKANTLAGDLPTDTSKWMECVSNEASLPVASETTLGGVKVDGDTITIDEDGVIRSIGGGTVRSVNNVEPDENGNIRLEKVDYADNLTSDSAQDIYGAFSIRTSGGSASIADGDAWCSYIRGNSVKAGYIPEVLEVSSKSPSSIYVGINKETWRSEVSSSGDTTFNYSNGSWDVDPATKGVLVSGVGDSASGSCTKEYLVTVDTDAFATAVSKTSGSYEFTFATDGWQDSEGTSIDLSDYGISVDGTVFDDGDLIIVNYIHGEETASVTIHYVKQNRGTITNATPSSLVSTGWNLYQKSNGYARVVGGHQYRVEGSYTSVAFAKTISGQQTALEETDGFFSCEEDGYVFVVGAANDTCIYLPWTDWVDGYEGEFEDYTSSGFSVPVVDSANNPLPFATTGLCAVGSVRDEINFDILQAYSKIERMAYTSENLEIAVESGRAYDTDENYIYLVRAVPVTYNLSYSVMSAYTVADHGIEEWVGTTVPVYTESLYGQNLKDKLRKDVVMMSEQNLTKTQRKQVRKNIGVEQTKQYSVLSTAWDETTAADVAELNSKLYSEFNVQTDIDATDVPYIARISTTDFSDDTKAVCEFPKITPANLELRSLVQYAYFTATEIVLYATDQPTGNGIFCVKGE